MKKIMLTLVVVLSSFANAELSTSFIMKVEQFYSVHSLTFPRTYVFNDLIDLKLKLPEEKAQNHISDVERIHKEDYVWQMALEIAAQLNSFHNEDYNSASEYLIKEYINNDLHRAAVQMLVDALVAYAQNPTTLRQDLNKRQSFMPHFEKGAAEYTWYTALAWMAVGGRMKMPARISGSKFSQAVRQGAKSAGARVAAARTILKDDLAYKVIGFPFKVLSYPVKFTKFMLYNRSGKVREFPRDVGAILAMAGGTGVAYGLPSFLLYEGKSTPQDTLDMEVYGYMATQLTCQVVDFSQRAESFNITSMSSQEDIEKTNEMRQSINVLADNFASIVDTASMYLTSAKVAPAILVENGYVKYKNLEPFYCEALKNHKGPVEVNLVWTRDKLRKSIAQVVNKINKFKLDSTIVPLAKFIEEKSGYAYGTIQSLQEGKAIFSEWVEQGVLEETIEQKNQVALGSQYFVDASAQIPGDWSEQVKQFVSSVPEYEEMDKLKLAVDDLINSSENATLFNYMVLELIKAGSVDKEKRASLVILSAVIHQTLNDYKLFDATYNDYLDPLKLIYFFIENPNYEAPLIDTGLDGGSHAKTH